MHKHPNALIWLSPPTPEQVRQKVKESGVPAYQFERYHNIPQNTLTQVMAGKLTIAAKYWHIFLEKPKHIPKRKKPKTLVKPKKVKPQPVVTNALKELLQ